MSPAVLPSYIGAEAASYEEMRADYLSFFAMLSGVLTVLLVMAGTLLDFFYYPEHWSEFFIARSVTSLSVAAAMWLVRIKASHKFTEVATMTWVMFPQAMISFMIARTGGVDSIYFVGLAYALNGLSVFLPLRLSQAVLFSIATLGMYLTACAIGTQGPMLQATLGGHMVFLGFFAVIMFSVTIYADRWRRETFQLQERIRRQVTSLLEANRTISEAKVQIAQSEKMASLGTMAAGLLHEMNNPVNYCKLAISLATEDVKERRNADAEKSLEDAMIGVKRLSAIINDLRHVAYQNKNGDLASFRLAEVARLAARLTIHAHRGFKIQLDIDESAVTKGDGPSIVSVLVNLIENSAHAIKRAGKGSDGLITISATQDLLTNRLRVHVRDNGEGLSDAVAERMFEPFFTTKDVNEGTGMGLSIAYSIIRRHDSELRVTSRSSGACELSFDLELVTDNQKAESHTSTPLNAGNAKQ